MAVDSFHPPSDQGVEKPAFCHLLVPPMGGWCHTVQSENEVRSFGYSESMTTEHRKAPRRRVERIDRVGAWGQVKYHHHLKCGHVEVRPRASKAPVIACAWCLKVAAKEIELVAATSAKPRVSAIDYDEELRKNEIEVAQLRAALAKALGVPNEAVDVVVAEEESKQLVVQSAVIFLTAADALRITRA